MNFGEKLKAIRLSKNLTQDELAALLGTTKQTISRYENSEREPNLRTAKDIAEKLNIDINILADDESELTGVWADKDIGYIYATPKYLRERAGISDHEYEIISAYRLASDADRQIIDIIVERYTASKNEAKIV